MFIFRSPYNRKERLVWSRHGSSNTSWERVEGIPISACSDYRVYFQATIPLGFKSPSQGHIAIDDVFFCEMPGNLSIALNSPHRPSLMLD